MRHATCVWADSFTARKRPGIVIGPCDRALGCEARARTRWRTEPSVSRVFTPQNRMRIAQSPCRVQPATMTFKMTDMTGTQREPEK